MYTILRVIKYDGVYIYMYDFIYDDNIWVYKSIGRFSYHQW